MPTLPYRGRAPDSDGSVVNKKWSDDTNAAIVVTSDYVNSRIINEIGTLELQTQTYIDTQDALRAQKTDVDAGDLLCVPASQLNAANGVAGLDSDGNLQTAQVPAGVLTDRVARGSEATYLLAGGSTQTVTTTNQREFKLAMVTIADPGFPWHPLPFGTVMGKAGGTDPVLRSRGNANAGLLTVLPPSSVSDIVYGAGVCTSSFYNDLYCVLPYGESDLVPSGRPAIVGGLTLELYGSCYVGNSYIFSGTSMSFNILVLPAVGG